MSQLEDFSKDSHVEKLIQDVKMGEGRIAFQILNGQVNTAKQLKQLLPTELAYLIICMELEIEELKKNFVKIKK